MSNASAPIPAATMKLREDGFPARSLKWMRPTGTRTGTAFEEFLRDFGRRSDQAEVCGQCVGCAERDHTQCDIGADKALQDGMHRAITAASNHGVAALTNCLLDLVCRAGRGVRNINFGSDAGRAKHCQRALNGCCPSPRELPRGRVIDQRDTLHSEFCPCRPRLKIPSGSLLSSQVGMQVRLRARPGRGRAVEVWTQRADAAEFRRGQSPWSVHGSWCATLRVAMC